MLPRFLALVSALAILFGASTGAGAAHLCSMVQAPEDECCCPHEDAGDADDQLAEQRDRMARTGCCELRAADQHMLPVPVASLEPAPAVAAAPPQRVTGIDLVSSHEPARFHGPAPPRPGGAPLYIRHCSYLI